MAKLYKQVDSAYSAAPNNMKNKLGEFDTNVGREM